jgi:hypothetical protein
MVLSKEEITQVFMNTPLEENYNFLQEDLVKLANAFVAHAEKPIARKERTECIKFVRSLNTHVAQALDEKRGKM